MLLAIDIGNTHVVIGVHDGASWRAVWRRTTRADETEDQLAVWLRGLFELSGLDFTMIDAAVCASVVPQANEAIDHLCRKWLKTDPVFVQAGAALGIDVQYDPPSAVGADRLANALGALAKYAPPLVIVDFGTATTFDAISAEGAYLGGTILPGVVVSSQALIGKTAKLPQIELRPPERAIGRNTVEALQSGIVLGYAGAIDTLAERISEELGGKAKVIATGGLGKLFIGVCRTIETYEPNLTLDGLLLAHQRLTA
jgi:type III pantothenate kinase